jgi:hypothetical protein
MSFGCSLGVNVFSNGVGSAAHLHIYTAEDCSIIIDIERCLLMYIAEYHGTRKKVHLF